MMVRLWFAEMTTQRLTAILAGALMFLTLFTVNAALLLATYFYRHLQQHASIFKPLIISMLATSFCVLLPATILFWSLARKSISNSHTLRSVLYQHVALLIFAWFGKRSYNKLINTCNSRKSLEKAQQTYLQACVKFQQHSSYGKQYNLSNITNLHDLQHKHPLTNYNFYAEYVKQLSDTGNMHAFGDARKTPTLFGLTSGTSGRPNVLPFYRRQASVFFVQGIMPMWHCLSSALTNMQHKLYKGVKFWYTPQWRNSTGLPNVRVGPASSSPQTQSSMLMLYTTPKEAFVIMNEPLLTYLHLLSALRDRQLLLMEANFASLVYAAISLMLSKWKNLVSDVKNGTITPPDADAAKPYADVLARISKKWKADSVRADELELAFANGLHGLAKNIWPELEVVICATTGSFKHYADLIRPYFAGVPIYSPIYAATEGLIGLNPIVPSTNDSVSDDDDADSFRKTAVDDEADENVTPLYILHPHAMVYELLPVQADEVPTGRVDRSPLTKRRRSLVPNSVDNNNVVASAAAADGSNNQSEAVAKAALLLHDPKIELNGVYELVITNASGLFRYRIGDVVAVRDFCGYAPVVEFLYRQGQRLDCRGEKLPEHLFYECLVKSCSTWLEDVGRDQSMKLLDYCATDLPMIYQEVSKSDDKNNSENSTTKTTHGYTVFIEFGFSFATLSKRLNVAGGDLAVAALKASELRLTSDEIFELNEALDANLQAKSYVYRSYRVKDAIGPVKCVPVMPGTFKRLRSMLLNSPAAAGAVTGAADSSSTNIVLSLPLTSGPNQMKIARVMRKPDALLLLQQSRWK